MRSARRVILVEQKQTKDTNIEIPKSCIGSLLMS